ncbi:MAG: pyruvate kinase [Planctomycetota bacterium]
MISNATRLFAILFVLSAAARPVSAVDPGWDFEQKPMPRIPGGVVVGGDTVKGWSNPILFVRGRLSAGDTDAVSTTVNKYAEMFNLVLLANVGRSGEGDYYLDKVALGFSTPIRGQNVLITGDTHRQLGANLGFIGGSVFSGNEEALKDAMQVARYRHGLVMDAPTLMLVNGKHVLRKVRHFIWVSGSDGKLGVLLWAMDDPGAGSYRPVDSDMQLLPPNMHETRHMHVDGDAFTLGIPSKTAFALVRVPQGRSIPFTDELRQVAGVRQFDQANYVRLLTLVSQAIQSAPVAASR